MCGCLKQDCSSWFSFDIASWSVCIYVCMYVCKFHVVPLTPNQLQRSLPVKRVFLPTVTKFLVIGGRLISLCYCRVFTLQYNAP